MKPGTPFLRAVLEAVDNDRLVLPSLPDVALRALELSRRNDISSARLADEVGRDPALAARLMRVANGAAHYGQPLVRNLKQAVARVGFRLTGVMAAALATDSLYRSHLPELAARLRRSRSNGVEVAALTRAIARRHTKLDADEAMLGGLLYEIGVLPIIEMAANDLALSRAPPALDEAIALVHARIGERLLRAWNFPPSLIGVPVACTQFERPGDGAPDIADVVSVALLHERPLREAWAAGVDRSRVSAYARLGFDPAVGIPDRDDLEAEMRATMEALEG
ncbi:MAG TPA: HDOD domain-containing protein [Nevskiaceae bacterium]|nr:HDOD domain-containing protein [Nevskiaceae bacterium]